MPCFSVGLRTTYYHKCRDDNAKDSRERVLGLGRPRESNDRVCPGRVCTIESVESAYALDLDAGRGRESREKVDARANERERVALVSTRAHAHAPRDAIWKRNATKPHPTFICHGILRLSRVASGVYVYRRSR